MSRVRLECVVDRKPKLIFVEISIDGEKLGMKNIGGDVEDILSLSWTKEKKKYGCLLWTEFEADVEQKMERTREKANGKIECIYLRNIREVENDGI